MRSSISSLLLTAVTLFSSGLAYAGGNVESKPAGLSPKDAADAVDRLISAELEKAGTKPAERCNDEDFLRRASLDVIGQLPNPKDVTTFRSDTTTDKRVTTIDKLVDSPEFGMNWARYWRDVIYMRATEQRSRLNQQQFTQWMADQWNEGKGWNSTVSEMLTAKGNVEENPQTALLFAQAGMTEDITAEACRIFLGIQLQCANCHDHPSDIWKREQFHQLAAYFPRVGEKRIPGDKPSYEIIAVNTENRRGDFMQEHPDLFIGAFDRNRDKKVSKEELLAGPKQVRAKGKAAANNLAPKKKKKKGADEMMADMDAGMEGMRAPKMNEKQIDRIFATGDTDKDGKLTLEEIKAIPKPDNKRRGSAEHHMADLKNPESAGTVIDPKFFVDNSTLAHGLSDDERRQAAAKAFTAPENPWFAKAIVNRIWAEMLGEGFYMPIDDMGPTRSPRYPEAMNVLCENFVASGYNPKWLIKTIANTEAYQRKIQPQSTAEDALPFASAVPVPLRSDVIFNSLMQVFDLKEAEMGGRRGAKAVDNSSNPRAYAQTPRYQFDALFGADPSTPKDDVMGNIPQSLMMMNSRNLRGGMAAKGDTRLSKILSENKDNRDALQQLYLTVLSRDPSANELKICQDYIAEVKPRAEAFEDLMWSLVNSSEFISRR